MGCFGIMGNHDFIHDGEEASKEFEKSGLKMLRNSSILIGRGGNYFKLTGLDYPWPFSRDRETRYNQSNNFLKNAISNKNLIFLRGENL